MRYFKTKINSPFISETTIKSLKSLLNKLEERLYVLPFCLFNKTYYSYLRELRHSPYDGIVSKNDFKFERNIVYGNITNSQRSRQLIIKGKILEELNNCKLEIEFHLSKFDVIFNSTLILSSLIALFVFKNYLFIAIPIAIILDVMNFTLRNFLLIRNRINKLAKL